MVTRETSYIGQLYFGLSSDDPADVAEWHNGDRILLMDQDQMFIYDEAAVTFHEIPMGGGGGGGGGLTLGGTGTYTQTTTISNTNITVTLPNPAITGQKCIMVDGDEVVSGVSQTKTWYRSYDIEEPALVASVFSDMLFQYITYNSSGTASRGGAIGKLYLDSNNKIHIMMSGTGFNIVPNTYTWYWWY